MKSAIASVLAFGASLAFAGQTHPITVGANGQLAFQPDQLTAAVGDVLVFQFMSANHSVVSSAFNSPCVPNGLIFSGFQPVSVASSAATTSSSGYSGGYKEKRAAGTVPEFSVVVNTTSPLWFYCAQASHCQKGMVMAVNVNATSNKTLAAYASAASLVPTNGVPTFGAQGGSLSTGSASSASASSTSTPESAGNMAEAGMFTVLVMAFAALFGGMWVIF